LNISPPFWHPALSKGFILDWDGVLADTQLDFSPIRARYFNGERLPLVEAAGRLKASEREALERDLYDLEMEGARKATPVRGSHELLEWLVSSGIPWAVVSRNCRDSIFEAADRCGIELPGTVLSRDEGPLKPDPRALWAAAGSIKVDPGNCVMIGDFIYDLYGAIRAGMRAVLVERTEPGWERWADISFGRLEDMVSSLRDPEPLVTREYRELVGEKGRTWLDKAWGIEVSVPEESPEVFLVAMEAARLGIGRFGISGHSRISLEQWEEAPFLPISAVDSPMAECMSRTLRERYPQVSVSWSDYPRSLPEDPSLVERAIRSWLK